MSVTCPGRRTGRYRFAGRGLVVRDCGLRVEGFIILAAIIRRSQPVFPAKAGSQGASTAVEFAFLKPFWIPACAVMAAGGCLLQENRACR